MALIEQDSKINKIRSLMTDGEERTADTVAEATGLDRKEVSVALSAETRARRLTRVSPGTYRWAREGEEAAAPPTQGKGRKTTRKTTRRGVARRAQRTEQVTEAPEDTIIFRVLATLEDGSLVCLRENGQLCKAYVADLAELGR